MPANRIAILMLVYGAVLGTLSGGVSLLTLSFFTKIPWQTAIPTALFFGPFFGLLFGGIAGVFNGLTMSEILPRYATRLNMIVRVRVLLGILTTIITVLVFSPLFVLGNSFAIDMQRNNFLASVIFSVGLSVYACQRVITRYLDESGLRKVKISS